MHKQLVQYDKKMGMSLSIESMLRKETWLGGCSVGKVLAKMKSRVHPQISCRKAKPG